MHNGEREKAERINERLPKGEISLNQARKEYGLDPISGGDFFAITQSDINRDSDMKKPALLGDVIKWYMKTMAYADKANLKANITIAMSIINAIAIFGIILFT